MLKKQLCEETVHMDLKAVERDEALEELLEKLRDAERVPEDMVDVALRALIEREKLGSTAIGNSVAVPHARVEELDEVAVAFGYSQPGVSFNALDGQPVHHVFLVVGPEGNNDGYAELMKQISTLVRDEDFRHFLRQSRSKKQIVDLIGDMQI